MLGSVLDSGMCFWILGSALDSGKRFSFWEVCSSFLLTSGFRSLFFRRLASPQNLSLLNRVS